MRNKCFPIVEKQSTLIDLLPRRLQTTSRPGYLKAHADITRSALSVSPPISERVWLRGFSPPKVLLLYTVDGCAVDVTQATLVTRYELRQRAAGSAQRSTDPVCCCDGRETHSQT